MQMTVSGTRDKSAAHARHLEAFTTVINTMEPPILAPPSGNDKIWSILSDLCAPLTIPFARCA